MNPRGEFAITRGRKIVNTRSDYVCERCGLRRAVHWHHRLNRSGGGTWHPSNGLHLCVGCHALMDQSDPELFRCGWRIKSHDKRSYSEIPVLHWQWGWVLLDDNGDYHLTDRPETAPCITCGEVCDLIEMWSTQDDQVECTDCHVNARLNRGVS